MHFSFFLMEIIISMQVLRFYTDLCIFLFLCILIYSYSLMQFHILSINKNHTLIFFKHFEHFWLMYVVSFFMEPIIAMHVLYFYIVLCIVSFLCILINSYFVMHFYIDILQAFRAFFINAFVYPFFIESIISMHVLHFHTVLWIV